MHMHDSVKLNLARKWRSRTFDEIVGQALPIRMLKNSLYLGHYFPVYLFSGQRGCGKTTTARVFAAALNCAALPAFQQNPKGQILPCLACDSCRAMQEMKHPDFIEMDAASHTGVDSIRQLIESSSFLPILGSKKVYLIDEAHMLSRASFNALLKLLEEPPLSVIFVLATTEPAKIIETVRSRCFRLIFKPIQDSFLLEHLQNVCKTESIRYTDDGLELIVRETEGSARDALNIIEQVRFAGGMVTKDAVLRVLGHVDIETLLELCEHVFCKSPAQLIAFLEGRQLHAFSAEFVWHTLLALLKTLLWYKYNVRPEEFRSYRAQLAKLAGQCSVKQINGALELLYANEQLFMRTAEQTAFLEVLLVRLCTTVTDAPDESGQNGAPSTPPLAVDGEEERSESLEEEIDEDDGESEEEEEDEDSAHEKTWSTFIALIKKLEDPLLNSIFQQGIVESFEKENAFLTVTFSKDFIFFQDWLEQSAPSWTPLLQQVYGKSVVFKPLFTRESTPRKALVPVAATPVVEAKQSVVAAPVNIRSSVPPSRPFFKKRNERSVVAPRGKPLDVSDTNLWPKTHLVTTYFPGTVTLVSEKQQ